MFCSAARLVTAGPDRYAGALRERLADDLPAEFTERGRGTIALRQGECLLVAGTGHLDVIAKAPDMRALAAVEDTIAGHLRPLAAPEGSAIDWLPLVRPAVLVDDAALVALQLGSWTAESGFPSLLAEDGRAFFGAGKTPETHLVAELGGELIGCVSVQPKAKLVESAHVFNLTGLVVARGARGLGVGSALLAAADRMAVRSGARKLSLQVLGTNPSAMRLYQRHGYVVEGRCVDEFLIDGGYVDDVLMGKHLLDR